MLGRYYPDENCSVARTLEIVGERWSLLIVRNAMFRGMTRFTDFRRSLGIAPNVLAKRLAEFVDAGIFELRPGEVGGHNEYVLTRKGYELQPIIVTLSDWGDQWAAPTGVPLAHVHEECGGQVTLTMECQRCGDSPRAEDVRRDRRGDSVRIGDDHRFRAG